MNKLVELMPSPEQAGPFLAEGRSGDAVELAGVDSDPFTAIVFKTTSEPHVGELSYFRVFSGTVDNGSTVYNPAHTTPERVTHLATPAGEQRNETPRLHAGDIGVVAKLKDTHTGDTLCADGRRLTLPEIEWPATDNSIAVGNRPQQAARRGSDLPLRLRTRIGTDDRARLRRAAPERLLREAQA
jgi:elongation factor G